ncbi:MAG: DUF4124 domain-containing protein [Gallionella sp.]|nr:DUF4124 domain-containing protein [Gallionella sp.]
MKKLLLILLVLTSANAVAGLNKWVDANGKVHYSDQTPPSNVKATMLRSKAFTDPPLSAGSVGASGVKGDQKSIADSDAEFQKAKQVKKEAAEKAAQEQLRAEANKAKCAALQQSILALESGVRLSVFSANGERTYMDDAQRQQDIAKARQELNTHCN